MAAQLVETFDLCNGVGYWSLWHALYVLFFVFDQFLVVLVSLEPLS